MLSNCDENISTPFSERIPPDSIIFELKITNSAGELTDTFYQDSTIFAQFMVVNGTDDSLRYLGDGGEPAGSIVPCPVSDSLGMDCIIGYPYYEVEFMLPRDSSIQDTTGKAFFNRCIKFVVDLAAEGEKSKKVNFFSFFFASYYIKYLYIALEVWKLIETDTIDIRF